MRHFTRRSLHQSSKTSIVVCIFGLLSGCVLLIVATQSLEYIQPGGAGHASSIRVRLLHAAVRRRIMKLARQRPEYYDVGAWGIPINDLDSNNR